MTDYPYLVYTDKENVNVKSDSIENGFNSSAAMVFQYINDIYLLKETNIDETSEPVDFIKVGIESEVYEEFLFTKVKGSGKYIDCTYQCIIFTVDNGNTYIDFWTLKLMPVLDRPTFYWDLQRNDITI